MPLSARSRRRLVLGVVPLLLLAGTGAASPGEAHGPAQPVAATTATAGYRIVVDPLGREIAASGRPRTLVVAHAWTDDGERVTGLQVTFSSTDPGHVFSTVRSSGNAYYATLTSSLTPGTSTITASSDTGTPTVVGAEITQGPYVRPDVTATVSSARRPREGWYRDPVTLSFTCTGSHLRASRCPAPVRLATSTHTQWIVRSVEDDEGVTDSTGVVLGVDLTPPRIVVGGVRDGGVYAYVRPLRWRYSATDTHSGIAVPGLDCGVRRIVTRSRALFRVRWTVRCTDIAGNVGTRTGWHWARHR